MILARYPTGGCSVVAVGDGTEGATATPTPFWTVRGGAALEVVLLEPTSSALQIRVFGVSGRLAAERQIVPRTTTARFSELASGVYFVRTVTNAGRTVAARAVIVQ